MMEENVVSTEWLAMHQNDPQLVVLDATMESIPGDNRHYADREFIPGALWFDIKTTFSCPDAALPHTVPHYKDFRQEVRKLGISRAATLVIYDAKGIYSAPRAWWLFKLMGHEKVCVLDGGLPKWIAEKRPLSPKPALPSVKSEWEGQYSPHLIADKSLILAASMANNTSIIDARAPERFGGISPEPREGIRMGHIPNAINIPFEDLLKNGCYRPVIELQNLFKARNVNLNSRIYFSCGSGITACIVLLAAAHCGMSQLSLYDGSWAEWGSDHSLPIASTTS